MIAQIWLAVKKTSNLKIPKTAVILEVSDWLASLVGLTTYLHTQSSCGWVNVCLKVNRGGFRGF